MQRGIQKSGEDYLETIFNLLGNSDHVHSVDIATALGVTKPSVSRALSILLEKGYIEKEKYGAVTLTEKGKLHAEAVQKKHDALCMLLTDVLGVSSEAANIDACRIEHFIGDETTEKLLKFLEERVKVSEM